MTDLRKSLKEAHEEITSYLAGDDSGVIVKTVHVPDDVDVKAVRESLGLTQAQFAKTFGFSLASVQSWERKEHRRKPGISTRVLLTALHKRPKEVLAALVEA